MSPVRSVAGKITRSGLVILTSRPPASTVVSFVAATPTVLRHRQPPTSRVGRVMPPPGGKKRPTPVGLPDELVDHAGDLAARDRSDSDLPAAVEVLRQAAANPGVGQQAGHHGRAAVAR